MNTFNCSSEDLLFSYIIVNWKSLRWPDKTGHWCCYPGCCEISISRTKQSIDRKKKSADKSVIQSLPAIEVTLNTDLHISAVYLPVEHFRFESVSSEGWRVILGFVVMAQPENWPNRVNTVKSRKFSQGEHLKAVSAAGVREGFWQMWWGEMRWLWGPPRREAAKMWWITSATSRGSVCVGWGGAP